MQRDIGFRPLPPLRQGLTSNCETGVATAAYGTPVARSKPIRCDSLDVPVEWEEISTDELNEPVVLQITRKNALLFALWSL